MTFNRPGIYYWQADYSGHSNNNAAKSVCTNKQIVIAPLIDVAVTKVRTPVSRKHRAVNISCPTIVANDRPETAVAVTIAAR